MSALSESPPGDRLRSIPGVGAYEVRRHDRRFEDAAALPAAGAEGLPIVCRVTLEAAHDSVHHRAGWALR
jgi:hypothetical protein